MQVQVLNLLLYKLTKQPYEGLLLEFLFADEHLVDIGDDLVDYEVRFMHCIAGWSFLSTADKAMLTVLAQTSCSHHMMQDDVLGNTFNIYRGG